MKTTIEQREGRVTEREYRATLQLGGRVIVGAWEYTRKAAVASLAQLKRAERPGADEAKRTMQTESAARIRRARLEIEHDRRI